MSNPEATDEKVPDQPERRQFTPEYKLRILQEIDKRRGEGRASSERSFAGKACTLAKSPLGAQAWRKSSPGACRSGSAAGKPIPR